MTDAEMITQVLALDAKATPAPWSVRKDYFDRSEPSASARYEVFPHTNGRAKPEDGIGDWTALCTCESYEPKNKKNADLIALYRTAAPKLAALCQEQANKLAVAREALMRTRAHEFIVNHGEGCEMFGLHPKPCSCGKVSRLSMLDAALRTIETK